MIGSEMFHRLLDPMVLEINLRSVWMAGVQDTEDFDISNR